MKGSSYTLCIMGGTCLYSIYSLQVIVQLAGTGPAVFQDFDFPNWEKKNTSEKGNDSYLNLLWNG